MPRDRLTAKEIQIADLVWQGLTNREIGKMIGTTEQVIKNPLRGRFDKLGVGAGLSWLCMSQATEKKGWLKIRIVHGSSLNRATASGCWSAALTFNPGRTQGTTDARVSCFPHWISSAYGTGVRTNIGATRGSVLQKVYL